MATTRQWLRSGSPIAAYTFLTPIDGINYGPYKSAGRRQNSKGNFLVSCQLEHFFANGRHKPRRNHCRESDSFELREVQMIKGRRTRTTAYRFVFIGVIESLGNEFPLMQNVGPVTDSNCLVCTRPVAGDCSQRIYVVRRRGLDIGMIT